MRPGHPIAAETAALAKTGSAGSIWEIACELFKLRLTSAVILTTAVGFYMGSVGRTDGHLMLDTLLGTALLACGAAAFNELLERDQDALMRRTQQRPLPAGQLTVRSVLLISAAMTASGLIYLWFAVSSATGLVGLATSASYLCLYTPLKRLTSLNTLVGAAPGALPAMIGWTAGRGTLWGAGWSLFAIVFLWQIPHFLAIGWIHRSDYARAGFRILALNDSDGSRSGRYARLHAVCLVGVSLCPYFLGLDGRLYFWGALALGGWMVFRAAAFCRTPSTAAARKLFHASVIYLPLLLALMAIGKSGENTW